MQRTEIRIDPAQRLGRINPHIYGHFIEHLGRCINGGVWAEMLGARKFVGFDDDHNGLPDPWTVGVRNPNVLASIEPDPDLGHRLCLQLLRDDGAAHGVSHPGVCVRAGQTYSLLVWAQAIGDVRDIEISLGGETICRPAPSGRWELLEILLNTRWDADDASLFIGGRGRGELRLRAASLMPAEARALGGYRPDVLGMARAIRAPLVRWPGGCFADAYLWRNGVGPRDARPVRFDPAWPAWEPNDFGTDEFVIWCREVGADPCVCVNTGSATAEDAAAWVQYCNGPADSEWGRVRAENGHPLPHDVRYWGVGNETYGSWEIGSVPADEYAQMFLHYAERMRAADPEIKLVAVGADPDNHPDWNRTVLEIAGGAMDYLSVHWYGPHKREDHRADDQYLAVVAAPVDIERRLRQVARTIDEVLGEDSGVEIAFDEWNVWLDAGGDTGIEERYELRDGLFAAGVFNLLHRMCERVTMANFAQLVNVLPAIVTSPTAAWGTPQYHAFRLYATSCQPVVVDCRTESRCFDSPAIGNIPALGSVPYLDAAATMSEDALTLAVSVVNRDPSADIAAEVRLADDATIVSASAAEMSGESVRATGSEARPDAVSISLSDVEASGGSFTHVFPAHSATVITLHLERP